MIEIIFQAIAITLLLSAWFGFIYLTVGTDVSGRYSALGPTIMFFIISLAVIGGGAYLLGMLYGILFCGGSL